MPGNGDAARRLVDVQARAAQPDTYPQSAPERESVSERDRVNDSQPRAAQAPRTPESEQAEQAYRDLNALPPSQRPLAIARAALARAFDAVMHDHWLRGNLTYSNVAIARACGVDEKTVRQWRDGQKPMPAAALGLLPSQIYDELTTALATNRGRRPKRGIIMLRDGLSGIRRELAHEDPRELRRALLDAQRELFELSALLEDDR